MILTLPGALESSNPLLLARPQRSHLSHLVSYGLFVYSSHSHAFVGKASRDGGSGERARSSKGRISIENGESYSKTGRVGKKRTTIERIAIKGIV